MAQSNAENNDSRDNKEDNPPKAMQPFIPFQQGKFCDDSTTSCSNFSSIIDENNQRIFRWTIASSKTQAPILASAVVPQRPNGSTEAPEQPAFWACWAGRTALEVLCGTRTTNAMQRWAHPNVLRGLRQIAPKHKAVGERPECVVRAVRLFEYSTRTYEAAVTVFDGLRFRAVGLRLENLRGRWSVTSLQVG